MPLNLLVSAPKSDEYKVKLADQFPDLAVTAVEDTPDVVVPHLADTDIWIALSRWVQPEHLARADRLRWFQCVITGTEHVEAALSGRDVLVTNTRGIHGAQMSEVAVLHMMALLRDLPRLVHNRDARQWQRFEQRVLEGRTIVILGIGAIAEHVARVCKALGMRTVGVTRTMRPLDGFDTVRLRRELLTAVAEADVVLDLLPLDADNAGLIGRDVFAAMKRTAIFVNLGRGGTVDEDALVAALERGTIAGAGLDVVRDVPLPPEHRLWTLPNVFITPLIGGQSDIYVDKAMTIIAPNLRAFIAGKPGDMINVVKL